MDRPNRVGQLLNFSRGYRIAISDRSSYFAITNLDLGASGLLGIITPQERRKKLL